jgi:hypothetical protein
MTDTLRKIPLVIALVLIALAFIIEAGASARLRTLNVPSTSLDVATPGYGILSLAFLDSITLFITVLIALPMLLSKRILGRIQGIATLIFSILLLIADIVMIIGAFVLLILMVSLLLAPIFGTIAYFAIYGHFDTDTARNTLALVMTLKLLFALCLLLAQQSFLKNKGLVLMVLLTLLCTFLVSFLQGFVPGVLASITDAIAALIVGIITAILAIIQLIQSIISVVKAVA